MAGAEVRPWCPSGPQFPVCGQIVTSEGLSSSGGQLLFNLK